MALGTAAVAIGITLSALTALPLHLTPTPAALLCHIAWTLFVSSDWSDWYNVVLATIATMLAAQLLHSFEDLLENVLPPPAQPWEDFFHAMEDLVEWVEEWAEKWEWRWTWKKDRDGRIPGAWSFVIGCSMS